MTESNNKIWKNPELKCGISPMEEPVRQLPYDKNFKATNDDLLSFCESMKKVFGHSDLTVSEANDIYEVLFKNKIYRNDASYGMPYKGAKQTSFTIELYKKRTGIRKLDNNKIAVFFYCLNPESKFQKNKAILNSISIRKKKLL